MQENINLTTNKDKNYFKNDVKSLFQIENDKKQKIIYKPKSDAFFQPLVILLFSIAIILATISFYMNAYSFSSISTYPEYYNYGITNNYDYNIPNIKISAVITFISAALFLICLLIRLLRSLVFVSINKEVKLEDVDSFLVKKFINRFIFYIFITSFTVTLTFIGVADISAFNNQSLNVNESFFNVYSHYWYIASIFAVITGSCFILYSLFKIYFYVTQIRKSDKKGNIIFNNEKIKNESYLKILLNKILILMIYISLFILTIGLFIYATSGINIYYAYIENNSNLIMMFQISNIKWSVAFFITGAIFSLTILFGFYTLVINNKITTGKYKKEEKNKKEKARIERINVKLEKKHERKKI